MDVNPPARTSAGTGTAPDTSGTASASEATERLRRSSFGMVCALLLQYGLGIGVNLFVNVPDKDQGKGTGAAFGNAFSNGPAALAAHAGIGLLLVINVIVALIMSIRTRLPLMITTAVVGLLSVFGAAFAGATFVDKGQNSASMTMAVLTGVAIACYAINLYVLGAPRKD
jgi:hypothetical protein